MTRMYKIQKLVGSEWVTITEFSPNERSAILATQATKNQYKNECVRLIDKNGCPIVILN